MTIGPAFAHRFATATASTKRNPAKTAGKIAAPTTNLASVAIVPPMPISPELQERYKIEAARRGWVTYAASAADIKADDVLTTGGKDYRVVAVAPWPSNLAFLEIILSE